MFYKKVTQTITLLFFPTIVFGVVVGDSVTVIRESHPFAGQTGTVLTVTDTGVALDFDGDGQFDGGVSLNTQGTNWTVGDAEPIYEFQPSDLLRWVFVSPNYYKIVSLNGTIEATASRGISEALGQGIYIPPSTETITIYGTGKDSVWEFVDVNEVETAFPQENQRFFIRVVQGTDPAGGQYGFLVVLDTYSIWNNETQMTFQVSDPQIFKTKIQTAYIYSGQANPPDAYADTIYKLKKINIYPLENAVSGSGVMYLNQISADSNNPSFYTNVTGVTATYTFKYYIHVTWDIIGSSNPNAPETYTQYLTDEVSLTSTFNQ